MRHLIEWLGCRLQVPDAAGVEAVMFKATNDSTHKSDLSFH